MKCLQNRRMGRKRTGLRRINPFIHSDLIVLIEEYIRSVTNDLNRVFTYDSHRYYYLPNGVVESRISNAIELLKAVLRRYEKIERSLEVISDLLMRIEPAQKGFEILIRNDLKQELEQGRRTLQRMDCYSRSLHTFSFVRAFAARKVSPAKEKTIS